MSHGFFEVVSVDWLLNAFKQFPWITTQESCSLTHGAGRVLARDLVSNEDLPPFTRSSMDGFAVNAQDTFGASESNPTYLECVREIAIDELPDFTLHPGQCAAIVTGAGLPTGADSVIMVEYTQEMGTGTIEIRRTTAPGENTMLRGEDHTAGETALCAGRRLRAQDLGLLAALGIPTFPVVAPVRVALISTGDEVVDVTATPRPGQIRDVNTSTLRAMVQRSGAEVVTTDRVQDDLQGISQALHAALNAADLVLISGGSSMGVRDHTLTALTELPECAIRAHGVAMSPGKPTIVAQVGDKVVLGLPGQVTSAQMVMEILGLPLLKHLSGEDPNLMPYAAGLTAILARNIASKQGREDYVRARLEPGDAQTPRATPVLGKSGLLKSLLQANGYIRIPAHSEGLQEGQIVTVHLF